MNRQSIIAALFALALLGGQSALAQSGYDLFQKGLVQERAKGDLEEAIRLYQQIVEDRKDDRALVAKALVQMGQCYEKLGRAEARKAYERVVQEYPDQSEPVRVAREHLEQLDGGAPATTISGPTYRLLFDDGIASMPAGGCRFSPSGDRIVFASDDKLCIADQTGTVIRTILDGSGPWKSPRGTGWSPDGRLISYRATREAASDSDVGRVHGIFVISPEGGTPRQIGPQVRGTLHGPSWTPDGKHLNYTTWGEGGGVHTITLDGDKVRFIRVEDMLSEGTRLHYGGSYSPDGRWIVYSRKKENARYRLDMDLYIIPATGGTPRRLTHLPEFNGHTKWAPDGRTIYFVSGPPHSMPGTRNIWKLAMDPETGSAKGEPQQVTFFKDVYIMWPQVLGDGDRIAFTMWRQNTSIQVADASSPHEARSLVRSGKYSPELSPDGQTVYYVNDKAGEEGIYAVSSRGGTPRRLTEHLPAKGYPHAPLDLSPDGKTLAFCAKLDNEHGLYTLPVSGGKPKLLVKATNVEFDNTMMVPQWSPDGSSLAYAAGKALYVIDGDSGEPRKLAALKGYWEEYSVRWSPDGKYIASLGSSVPNSKNAVFVVPASGGEPRQLTPVTVWLQRLEWHPDGKRLTYHASRYNSETCQAYLDGRPPTLLVDAPGVWDYEGAWAPDGRRFFFLASGGSEPEGLYVYDEASGKTTFVDETTGVAEEGVPSWSRDGKTMAWTATRMTARQTWIMENFQTASRSDDGKSEVTIRKVFDRWGGAPSPDGRYLVFCDWDAYGDLAVHDLVTGENRDLSHGARDWDKRVHFADGYRWSPDGKQIAYAWLSYTEKKKPHELCVVGLDGSEPRVLHRFEDKAVKDIVVHDWSQDGKFILAGFYKKIIKKTGPKLRLWDLALVSVADGSMRILKSIGPPVGRPSWQVSRSLSPDGRYMVYARSVEEDKGFRNIFVLATDGSGEEIPLVQHPADDCSPIWAPDGKTIVVSSDRSGTYDTWLIHVADGKPVGEPQLVKKSTGSMIPVGFTREGSLYYKALPNLVEGAPWGSMGDIYTASLDPITGKILVPPKKAIQQFEGFNATAAWSPDGKRLAYISARAQPARGSARRRWALVIRSLETGQERELAVNPPTVVVGPCWSPDGRSIVCRNQLVKGMISPGHLSLIDAQTGDATPIVRRGRNTNGVTYSWVWSPHGKTVYYVIGQDGPARIMVHDLETGNDKEICGKVNRRTGLAISPDGRQLAFGGSERKSIMVVSVKGGEPRALLRLHGEESLTRFTLAWTPDGHYVLFGKGYRPTELWRVSVEGGEPQKLMETETLVHLGIHPDGQQIVFTAVPRREGGTWVIDNFLPESSAAK